ncbi:hypothetical protein BKA66DRAFT_588457 [Pyrenochaeta sp. MPI-SDFR-AT-0127]|nr:hypothetical protein BKA66DRAFT_588457 [Pyrenochaeta sp. MPI-SDFR-AT-0127]
MFAFTVLLFIFAVSSQITSTRATSAEAFPTTSSAILLSISSKATPTPLQPTVPATAHNSFLFDGSCDQVQQDLVRKSFNDARQMSKLASENWANHQTDPAFWDLFGPSAVRNLSSIEKSFKDIVEGAWNITVVCDLHDAIRQCTDRYMYGGIGEYSRMTQEDYSPTLIFCREFFGFPTLDTQVQQAINIGMRTRLDLGAYHENQALGRPISNLWAYMRHRAQSATVLAARWTACYGISCAKLLAQLSDENNDWSVLNADNYALFALSKYVSQLLHAGEFAWLPRLNLNTPWTTEIVQRYTATGVNTFAVTGLFGAQTVSQLRYNLTRYQSAEDVIFRTELPEYRQADIWNAPWVPEDLNYSQDYISRRGKFYEEWSKAVDNDLRNIDTIRNLTCFGQDSGAHPIARAFDLEEATQLAKQFCNKKVRKALNDSAVLYPAALVHDSNATSYLRDWLGRPNGTAPMNFYIALHPSSVESNKSFYEFFEGKDEDLRVAHCWLTFKHIIENCDQSSSEKFGGVMTLNDRVYAAIASPNSQQASIANITPVSDFQCADYNLTSYWHASTYLQVDDSARLGKLCTCWYNSHPFGAQMFCKKQGVDCANLASAEDRIWARSKAMQCD